jgi:hypothetical protein
MKRHFLNPALNRAFDVLGLHARDDGDYQLGAQILTLAEALELVKLLEAGVRFLGMNEAKAFVMGLPEGEVDRLLRACLWRFRGKADVALVHVREAYQGELGPRLYEALLDRAIALHGERQKRGLEP